MPSTGQHSFFLPDSPCRRDCRSRLVDEGEEEDLQDLGNSFDPFEKASQLAWMPSSTTSSASPPSEMTPITAINQMRSRLNGDFGRHLRQPSDALRRPEANPSATWPALVSLPPVTTLYPAHQRAPRHRGSLLPDPRYSTAVIAIFDLLREVNVFISENEPVEAHQGWQPPPRHRPLRRNGVHSHMQPCSCSPSSRRLVRRSWTNSVSPLSFAQGPRLWSSASSLAGPSSTQRPMKSCSRR